MTKINDTPKEPIENRITKNPFDQNKEASCCLRKWYFILYNRQKKKLNTRNFGIRSHRFASSKPNIMETKAQCNLLTCVERIYESAQKSKLTPEFFEKHAQDIALLSDFLKIDPTETVLFAVAFICYFEKKRIKEVFEHLGLKEFHQLYYQPALELLFEKQLLTKKTKNYKRFDEYNISKTVIQSISKGIPLTTIAEEEELYPISLVDVLQPFREMQEQLDNQEVELAEFKALVAELVAQNRSFPLMEKLHQHQLSPMENYLFLKTLCDVIDEGDNDYNTSIFRSIREFYPIKGIAFFQYQKIIKKESKLTKLGLIEVSKEHFSNEIKARLSDEIILFLAEHENMNFGYASSEKKEFLSFSKIATKELWYGESIKAQIQMIEKALDPRAFRSLQERLEAKALPKGVSVLLHGAPGTGKTETVYQLAQRTQRNIYKVDISETKSMWFGESQKLIKKVFDTYEHLRKTEQNTPILLFNEADGLISKRKDNNRSAVADTENAIQNILLDELERFNGIFFATTNFVQNMDEAFERRFLFKVKFEKPSVEGLRFIWQHKLPELSEAEVKQLAQLFAFSGGEIDNIVRKIHMHELLQGVAITFDDILQYAQQEKWHKQSTVKMGF